MKKRLNLPLEQQISYNPETGEFHRLVARPHAPIGSRADAKLDTHGYRMVRVGGKEYRAHRLAWFMTHGAWPPADLDHINHIRSDNRLSNLREATRSENLGNSRMASNNTSGFKGVHLHKASGRWQAYITFNYKRQSLGYFNSPQAAAAAYLEAAKKQFLQFAYGAESAACG